MIFYQKHWEWGELILPELEIGGDIEFKPVRNGRAGDIENIPFISNEEAVFSHQVKIHIIQLV